MAGVSTFEYLVLNRQVSYGDHINDVPVTFDHAVGKITKMWMRKPRNKLFALVKLRGSQTDRINLIGI